MNVTSNKQEALFDLVRSMSKAEKRNFKLYATRLAGNQEAKFVALFDCMEGMEEYDEARILQRCPIKKEQLPNLKAHLYKQILVSLRLLDVQRNYPMQLREQVDFAQILYDRGLYRQSDKILEKIKEQAFQTEQHTISIDIIALQKKMEVVNLSRGMSSKSELNARQVSEVCVKVITSNDLSNISMQLYGLYLKLGYARTQKDIDLIVSVFSPQLAKYHETSRLSFLERFYLYQAHVWYSYIQHDILTCYKYSQRWVALFNANPAMKQLMYDAYMRGYSRLLEGLFLLRSYKRFVMALEAFEHEVETLGELNDNARMISDQIIYTNRINRYFYEGDFTQGLLMVPAVEEHLREHPHLSVHLRMVLYYKVACLYFGNADYRQCIAYLERVISTRDPQIRRDLQCYARILHLISSYELGLDHNLEYQVRSLYQFLLKMNDMQHVQRELLSFLKRLNTMYESSFKDELRGLYERLRPYENHPYERRTFYYLDLLSWLQGKLEGLSVSEVIRHRFLAENTPIK